jgi:hypothetical protein
MHWGASLHYGVSRPPVPLAICLMPLPSPRRRTPRRWRVRVRRRVLLPPPVFLPPAAVHRQSVRLALCVLRRPSLVSLPPSSPAAAVHREFRIRNGWVEQPRPPAAARPPKPPKVPKVGDVTNGVRAAGGNWLGEGGREESGGLSGRERVETPTPL